MKQVMLSALESCNSLMRPYVLVIILAVSFSGITIAYAQTYSATLILNSLPSSVTEGDVITFSGQLTTSDGSYVIPNRTIYIKDDIPLAPDSFIGSIVTDSNGQFSAT